MTSMSRLHKKKKKKWKRKKKERNALYGAGHAANPIQVFLHGFRVGGPRGAGGVSARPFPCGCALMTWIKLVSSSRTITTTTSPRNTTPTKREIHITHEIVISANRAAGSSRFLSLVFVSCPRSPWYSIVVFLSVSFFTPLLLPPVNV